MPVINLAESELIAKLESLEKKLEYSENNSELLQEALGELELAIEDSGWLRMAMSGDREFSQAGLRKIRHLARLMFLKNPLIKHAVLVQANYVFGQGVSIIGDPAINDVVQDFLDDPKNSTVLTGHSARRQREIQLQLQGDLFAAMFTNLNTGRVIVRPIHPDEISDIIYNPEDDAEPWFYLRTWNQPMFSFDAGNQGVCIARRYYPDWRYLYNRGYDKPQSIADIPIAWDAPIYHLKVGGLDDMHYGVPEVYAALDWAKIVKEDLEQYATVKKALARFAWNMKTKGGPAAVTAARTKLNTKLVQDTSGSLDSNPPPVTGSTFIGSLGANLDPMRTAGTQPPPEEGRRLGLMVAAATGVPETILFGNADVGNLATARTLDRPTELQMRDRQTLWADVLQDIIGYVVDCAIAAPNGELYGRGEWVELGDGEGYYELLPDTEAEPQADPDEPAGRSVRITFPSILERDTLSRVQAIVQAVTMGGFESAGTIPDEDASRLLLDALGVENIDETLDELYPDNELTTLLGPGKDVGAPGTDATGQKVSPEDDTDADIDAGDTGPVNPTTSPSIVSPDVAMIAAARSLQSLLRGTRLLSEPRGVYVHKKRGRKARIRKGRHGHRGHRHKVLS